MGAAIFSYETEGPYNLCGEMVMIARPTEQREFDIFTTRDLCKGFAHQGFDDEFIKLVLDTSDEIPRDWMHGARILFLGQEMFYEGRGYFPGIEFYNSDWVWTFKWSDEVISPCDWVIEPYLDDSEFEALE